MHNEATGFDFFALITHYTVGYYDIFRLPISSSRLGGVNFIGVYAIVVVLFGIPAFAEEFAYLMPRACRSCSKKWIRSYEIVTLLQIIQISISESDEKLSLAVTQIFTLLNYRNFDVLPLFSKNCRIVEFGESRTDDAPIVTNAAKNSSVQTSASFNALQKNMLQPSCLRRPRSEIACIMNMLFSNPDKIFQYTMCMLSIIILAYAITFGRPMPTYGKISRVYLALIVLCISTLVLHFVGRNSAPISEPRHDSHTMESLFSNALLFCIRSLGVANFYISVIGAQASKDSKNNFVSLAICACMVDFAISTAFTGLSYLRKSTVKYLCDEFTDGQFDFDEFMSMPDIPSSLRNSSHSFQFSASALWGSLQMSESLLMFRETSGTVPWTVYLPFQVLIMLFSVLLICMNYVLCDLHAFRLFGTTWIVLGLAMFRFAVLTGIILLRMFGQLTNLSRDMSNSVPIWFFFMKIFECVSIHLNKGFSAHIKDRRSLLQERQKIQLFIFDWYLAPSTMLLYNFGYPVACAVLIMMDYQRLLTLEFCVYFLLANALPSLLVISIVHAYLS